MPATLVPTVKTTCQPQELIDSLIKAWLELYGEIPKKESIGVIYAQNSLETGGTVSMYNYNLCNVKYIPSLSSNDDNDKQFCMLNNVWEIINLKKQVFNPPNRQTWFRAFPSLKDGCSFYLDFLKNKRYKNAWKYIEDGNPSAFAHVLKTLGYYTAPESDYIKAITFYYNKYMNQNWYEITIDELQKLPTNDGYLLEKDEVNSPIEEKNSTNIVGNKKSIIDSILDFFK